MTLGEHYKSLASKSKSKHVDLTSKNITDLNIRDLIVAIRQTPVKSLDLSGNVITDEGFKSMCKVLCDTGIEKINLSKNKIGEKHLDQAIQILRQTKNALRHINLSDNLLGSKITKNRVKSSL